MAAEILQPLLQTGRIASKQYVFLFVSGAWTKLREMVSNWAGLLIWTLQTVGHDGFRLCVFFSIFFSEGPTFPSFPNYLAGATLAVAPFAMEIPWSDGVWQARH